MIFKCKTFRLLEQNKAELTKAEGAEGGGETRRERRERWAGGAVGSI